LISRLRKQLVDYGRIFSAIAYRRDGVVPQASPDADRDHADSDPAADDPPDEAVGRSASDGLAARVPTRDQCGPWQWGQVAGKGGATVANDDATRVVAAGDLDEALANAETDVGRDHEFATGPDPNNPATAQLTPGCIAGLSSPLRHRAASSETGHKPS